jgi:hypothetical protein
MRYLSGSCARPSALFPVVLLAAVIFSAPAGAQERATDDPRSPPECFRFAFGAWDPPLDWTRAGHAAPPQAGVIGLHGRENAARDLQDDREPLLIFPAFWPVGVLIRFESQQADTLRGVATALSADAARAPSRARVTGVRIPCGEPAS